MLQSAKRTKRNIWEGNRVRPSWGMQSSPSMSLPNIWLPDMFKALWNLITSPPPLPGLITLLNNERDSNRDWGRLGNTLCKFHSIWLQVRLGLIPGVHSFLLIRRVQYVRRWCWIRKEEIQDRIQIAFFCTFSISEGLVMPSWSRMLRVRDLLGNLMEWIVRVDHYSAGEYDALNVRIWHGRLRSA